MLNNNNIRRKNVILQKGQIEWGWARHFDQSATDIAMTDRRAGNMTYDKVVDSNRADTAEVTWDNNIAFDIDNNIAFDQNCTK